MYRVHTIHMKACRVQRCKVQSAVCRVQCSAQVHREAAPSSYSSRVLYMHACMHIISMESMCVGVGD